MTPLTRRTYTLRLVAACSLLAAVGCSGPSKDDCNDGFDNDGDGLIDGADPGCDLNGDLEAPDPTFPQCSDGADNDGDALVDFPEDPGCASEDDDDEFNEPPAAQCADGIDNDGDGRIDYPNDPGCTLALEDSEDDDCPDGPECPQCSDGKDNDADGDIDYPSDPGCGFAADADEFNTVPGVCGPSVDVIPLPADGIATGSHLGSVPNELQSPDCSGRGGETVYTLTVDEPSSLFVTTNFPETTLDTVVYVRGECRNPDTELGCNDDDPDASKVSTLLIPAVEPGVYYIVIDAFGPGSIGDFKMEVRTFKGEGEACDPAADPSECPPGLVCRKELPTSSTETCVRPECDDGNDNDGDALSDYPDDPGCTDLEDNDETDDCPGGPTCPQCANGVDDDGDTFTDYPDDPGCGAASDNVELDECIPGVEVLEIPGGTATGTTVGGSMSFTASCDSDSSMSPERIHGFRTTFALTELTFSTEGSTFANTLYVRETDCATGADVACAPNTTSTYDQTVTIPTPTVGTNYFAFVDGDWSTSGDYTLNVYGKIPGGDACTPSDGHFTCELGYYCDGTTSVCETSICNDGADNDGDTLIDYPNDPGCLNPSDTDETDDCPGGASCPECGNGSDDDGDTLIDYPDDPGCVSAADGNEIDECIPGVEVLELDPELGATGTTTGTGSFDPSCDSFTEGEVVYAYRLTRTLSSLTFDTTASGFDTVTHVRLDTCDLATAEVACNDPGSGGEITTIASPAMGTYFVFVDGDFGTGTYDLQMSGTIPGGDPCDPASGAFRCEDGTICDTGSLTCVPTECNDGADNDGDTKIDDADPGCSSVLDDSEEPDPSPLPQCANGTDDDADTLIDYPDDPGCSRASDDLELDCTESDPVVEVDATPEIGSTVGATNDFVPSCSGSSTAPEIAHTLQFPGALDSLTIDTFGSGYDTVVYMKAEDCGSSDDVACDDDDGGLQSRICTDTSVCTVAATQITPVPVPAGVYFIFVDGFSSSSGSYTLNITGVISAGAECDMGQISAGIFSCAAGTTCMDDGAGTDKCL